MTRQLKTVQKQIGAKKKKKMQECAFNHVWNQTGPRDMPKSTKS